MKNFTVKIIAPFQVHENDEILSNFQLAHNDINVLRGSINEITSRVCNEVTETKQSLERLSSRLHKIETFLDTSGIITVDKLYHFNNE